MNAGFAASSGDAIIVLDDDDLQPPYALSDHAAALEANPGAGYSYGRFRRFRGNSYYDPGADPDPADIEPAPLDDPRRMVVKLMEVCFLPNPAWMARRSALAEAGPYDENAGRSQDYDMILRLARNDEGAFADAVVLHQRKHSGPRVEALGRFGGEDNVFAWIEHDKAIFSRIAKKWSIEDFRPFVRQPDPAREVRYAWLQRGVIFFLRKLYEEAFLSLQMYRRYLGGDRPDAAEHGIAARLLACRYGIADLTDGGPKARFVSAALREGRWPLSLRRAFMRQAHWRLRHAFGEHGPAATAPLLSFLAQAFGPGAALGLAAPMRVCWPEETRCRLRS